MSKGSGNTRGTNSRTAHKSSTGKNAGTSINYGSVSTSQYHTIVSKMSSKQLDSEYMNLESHVNNEYYALLKSHQQEISKLETVYTVKQKEVHSFVKNNSYVDTKTGKEHLLPGTSDKYNQLRKSMMDALGKLESYKKNLKNQVNKKYDKLFNVLDKF